MELEDLVVSLDLAQKLKEIGYNEGSILKWVSNDNKVTWHIWPGTPFVNGDYPAWTAGELLELLPPNINEWGLCFDATSIATQDGIKSLWSCTYADYDKKMFNELSDKNIANLAAKILLHLHKHSLMPEEKNV